MFTPRIISNFGTFASGENTRISGLPEFNFTGKGYRFLMETGSGITFWIDVTSTSGVSVAIMEGFFFDITGSTAIPSIELYNILHSTSGRCITYNGQQGNSQEFLY